MHRIEDAHLNEEETIDTGPERAILCAACHHSVTTERVRMSVNGSHEHRFFNPHGFLFHMGCFRAAPGCVVRGQPTAEFSWFSNFLWSHALCGGCGGHLGWRFQKSAATFFGLILNRLMSKDV